MPLERMTISDQNRKFSPSVGQLLFLAAATLGRNAGCIRSYYDGNAACNTIVDRLRLSVVRMHASVFFLLFQKK